jgi:hypothetical protein
LIPSAQRENFHQIEWDKKIGIPEEKKSHSDTKLG